MDVFVFLMENLFIFVRQEFQGEENQFIIGYFFYLDYGSSDNGYSILVRFGMFIIVLEMKILTILQLYY